MILEYLNLEIDRWGENEGRYIGKAKFSGKGGKVEINLSPDTSDKILALLADQLVVAAQETASLLTAQVIATAAKQLENLSNENTPDPF
jgi:hypothetical protein